MRKEKWEKQFDNEERERERERERGEGKRNGRVIKKKINIDVD